MKNIIYFMQVVFILLFSCSDPIDNLNQIAGVEDFEMLITDPGKGSFVIKEHEYIIRWKLEASKAAFLRIELVKDNAVINLITSKTTNDGEYVWENISDKPGDKYSIRLTITGGVYSGKYRESGNFTICSSVTPVPTSVPTPAITPVPESEIIYFNDINLEQVIRDRLRKQTGYIYKDDVKDILYLDLRGKNISDITGLEYFYSLRTLDISMNEIIDISPLADIPYLLELDASYNNIENISASMSSYLCKLDLANNKISGLSGLSSFYSLIVLDLSFNSIIDISPLEMLTGLEILILNNNTITDISILNNLANIKELNLDYNNIADISVISGLINLTHLDLAINNIAELPSLSNNKSLEYLSLIRNKIVDISELSNLDSIQYLDVSINCIADISPLIGLNTSAHYYLDNNPLSDESKNIVEQLKDEGICIYYYYHYSWIGYCL